MFKLCITNDLGFELWKDIPGWEGYYQGSTYGRVKSLERIVWKPIGNYSTTVKERILKQNVDDEGYCRVKLSKEDKHCSVKVHRIIAETFLFNPSNLPMVNHKNENKTNNSISNLEYCDCTYNNNYGTRNERISKALKNKVLQYDTDGNFLNEWDSCIDVEKALGYPIGTICHRCNGTRNNKYKGYIWKYKEDA